MTSSSRPARPLLPRWGRLRLAPALAAFAVVTGACSLLPGDDAATGDGTPAELANGDVATGDGSTGEETGEASEPGGSDGAAVGDSVVINAEFSEGPCGFDLPTDTTARCGTVAVPMDWTTGEGRIDLAVAVFEATTDDAAPDPVVYLEGGPGGHALETTRFVDDDLLNPLRARGDVIIFDQRGAGLSEPRLDCGELDELTRELEDTPNIPDDEVDGRFHDALRACRDRLTSEGVDLGAFTSINNAHDVEAIRVALGYDSWNLYGISYGTKLGLEVMRQHPDGVRTAVLDSVFPPQVDSALENPATFVASWEAVVEACGQEPACAAQGDLAERMAAVVQRYDAEPIRVEVRDFLTGDVDQVSVEGETIIGVVNQALYSPLAFTDLPELVAELEAGEVAAIESYLSQHRSNEAFFTDGMFYAIECNEEVPFADPDAVEAALPADPFGLRDVYNYASNNGTNAFGTCEAFGSTPAPDVLNEPVVSSLPTLVMAGRYDPVTPVAWAEEAARHLDASHLVVDPFGSHGVSTGECGMSVVVAFLDEPTAAPDPACYAEGSIRFFGVPDEAITFETTTRPTSGGSRVTTVRPDGWIHGDLPGDSYRQASFLDPTQLIQVADEPLLKIGLEYYLSETVDVVLGRSVDRPGIGGHDWSQRSGRSDRAAVEWYETEIGGATVFVILVSTPDELEANIESVLLPALEAIEVG